MDALENFKLATTYIAEGKRAKARRHIANAIRWIDATGKDKAMRADLLDLLDMMNVWQNDDGTWSHHKDAKCRWASRGAAETDLRFHNEWSKQ